MASTTSGTSTASATGTSSTTFALPSSLKVVGIILAVASGVLIGSSFVFKKKGLLRSQAGHAAGEGVAYLKSPLWWLGMTMMILGELCNFAAYAFVEALVVTPMGALSVVICAILSSIFLKEKLTFFGWLGCALCIIGSVIIALNGPQEQSVGEIDQFKALFIAPGFLTYISVLIAIALSIIIYFGPRYGKNSMMWYIAVCSTIGGISVSVTTGLGSAIVSTAMGHNQFDNWFIYFLFAFVAVTLVTEVYYLNVALALFNTVTPTYYVLFSFCSMLTTIVLFQGLKASVSQILTIVLAFLTICVGITILQMSKIDPVQLSKLDRKSTILLQAARSNTESVDEKSITGIEDPGIDTLRGSFGTMGSIIRARSARRMSQSSGRTAGSRFSGRAFDIERGSPHEDHTYGGMTRHQLYDAPVPRFSDADRQSSLSSVSSPRRTTIKFGSQDLVHSYSTPGSGAVRATHEHRAPNRTTPPDPDAKTSFIYPPNADAQPSTPSTAGYSQTVPVPSRANDEPHPPTVHTSFPGQSPAVDPFDTPTTPTMSAFPSSTDLLASNSHTPLYGSESDDEHPLHRPRTRSTSTTQSRRYPRGPDDPEESASLWEQRSPIDEEDGDSGEEHHHTAGIRLVPSGSGTRF
ncbi:magnesium transporter NIPA-domain-containing protein [Hygrophoropsis aurantiaca]|uniref:Magnesium transporter NIPA-domain-containing protein n=1 Tax=Hygrophoropsis aurantiaca TaxID=72124 RepID=A0ACB8ASP1_9AGAM|nr:magnesium transporter NIPA-domain-containing protein [Hygrophoropsis aurantiaca]